MHHDIGELGCHVAGFFGDLHGHAAVHPDVHGLPDRGQAADAQNPDQPVRAEGAATRPAVTTPTFTEDYPKEGVSYTVQKGDTLSNIAHKTGAKMQDIINANKIADPTRLQVGQTLFIPQGK